MVKTTTHFCSVNCYRPKSVVLCTRMRFRCIRVCAGYIARAQPCNFRGVASGCPLFRGKNVRWSAVRREYFVRCPESGSVRFSEVANVLQLWYFQSVTRQVSVVAWVSASRKVRYGRFHCIHVHMYMYSISAIILHNLIDQM